MVDVSGHLGMALVWLAPFWFVLDRPKTAVAFVGIGFWFGLLPDTDLYLREVFPTIHHHGVVHTVLAVTLIAAVVGPLLGWALERWSGKWFSPAFERHATLFGFAMVWVPGLSHIFADMLSAPDISQAVEPFWPLYQQSIGIDLVWYDNPWFNWGLLVVGVTLHVALYATRNSTTAPDATHQ